MAEKKPVKSLVRHVGGCHCGAVRFEVWAPSKVAVWDCTCSICVMKQNKQFLVPDSQFRIFKGVDQLTCYTFNTHQAKHVFCKICGVQSFFSPRAYPGGKAISPHCLDEGTLEGQTLQTFDGQNWEAAFETLGGSHNLES
ncbi:centromere protein V-like [Diadema setosum]|uniref:centromere protein V-like n=1 Tax=Diadema setosum TaxID=31175 RepID=UPI003B3A1E54